MYLLIFIISIFIFLIWHQWRVKGTKMAKMLNEFPGPSLLPILAIDFEGWKTRNPVAFFNLLRVYSLRYKKPYRAWLGIIGSVNICTPEDVEAVLSNMKHIDKSFMYRFLHRWLGTGLLTSTGKKWQTRRKILTPSFHFNILQSFVEVIGSHCENLIKDLKEECKNPQTDVIPIITQSTLNIICDTAMGTKLDVREKKDRLYVDALHELSKLITRRIRLPWLFSDITYNLTWYAWYERRYVKILHDFTDSVIRKREENYKDSDLDELEYEEGCKPKKRLAMLDLLINCKRKTGNINDEGIREEVDTFMFEGHDTTSVGLSYAIMLLANHIEAQDKIFEECSSIFGNSKRMANYEDLQNMQYTGRFIKESLRLYPSVPLISRELNEDLVLSNGVAPAGCTINIHIYDLHRNPDIYPDPEKFDPDRFLPENVQDRHPYSHIAFSAGPRNCIGQRFAVLEFKSILSSIVRNYILKPIDRPEDMKPMTDIVLRNTLPIYVKFTKRESLRSMF